VKGLEDKDIYDIVILRVFAKGNVVEVGEMKKGRRLRIRFSSLF
jgi:hypothetical protein